MTRPPVEVTLDAVSVWFGQKVALSGMTCSFGPGLTGLVGPNGAGKTTLMRAVVGLQPTGEGTVRVGGLDPRDERSVQAQVALVPEDDTVPGALTARGFVTYTADLHGVDRSAVDAVLEQVDLVDVAHRRLDGFSKGMRQRAKVAAALVTDPAVLVLDEPLNGADPVQRRALIALFRQLAAEGRTVIVSSHVLHEVEQMVDAIVMVVSGRLAAAGGHRAIREALHDRPRRVRLRTPTPRRLAPALAALDIVSSVSIVDDVIDVSCSNANDLALALPGLARQHDLVLTEVRPLDDSLESIFRDLVS